MKTEKLPRSIAPAIFAFELRAVSKIQAAHKNNPLSAMANRGYTFPLKSIPIAFSRGQTLGVSTKCGQNRLICQRSKIAFLL